MAGFGCNCGTPVNLDEDEFTKYTISSVHTHSSDSDESAVFNTSYRRATPLFRAIEKENWEGVLMFLTTGKWSNSILANAHEYMKSPAPQLQVKTWVTSYDHKQVPEWSQLPLHAAISYNAPFVVIRKLVECYPKSIQCTDNEGMLPIHLAFGFGASDQVLAFLLEPFPASINERGLGGRLPFQCCELGPNKARGTVFDLVVDQVGSNIRAEVDQDWRDYLVAAQRKLNLDNALDPSNAKLSDVLLELLKNRKELEEIKKRSNRLPPPRPIIKPPNSIAPSRDGSHAESSKSGGSRKFAGSVTSSIRSITNRARRKGSP